MGTILAGNGTEHRLMEPDGADRQAGGELVNTVAWRSREARLSSCPRRRRKCSWPGVKKKTERPPHLYLLKTSSTVSARCQATQKTQQTAFNQQADGA